MGYDDSLDVFGVHCIGGIVGCVLTGVCSYEWIGGFGDHTETVTIGAQTFAQIKGAAVTLVWSGAAAYIALTIAKVLCGGIRASEDDEASGLDVTEHGEGGYNL